VTDRVTGSYISGYEAYVYQWRQLPTC